MGLSCQTIFLDDVKSLPPFFFLNIKSWIKIVFGIVIIIIFKNIFLFWNV